MLYLKIKFYGKFNKCIFLINTFKHNYLYTIDGSTYDKYKEETE